MTPIPVNSPCSPLGVDKRTSLNNEIRKLAGQLAIHVENIRDANAQTVDIAIVHDEVSTISLNVPSELGYVVTHAMSLGRAIEKREHDNRLIRKVTRG